MQPIYRTVTVSYVLVVLNSCLSVAVGLLIWFIYEPPSDAAPTIHYGLVGGLQLWCVFFANVVLLVAKASHSSSVKWLCYCYCC